MNKVGYYNGTIAPLEELMVPALDRAIYFGDGCYDASTFCHNRMFAVKDHFDRFYNSCRLLKIDFTMSREDLLAEIQKVIDANELDHGMIYWQVSRGTYTRTHAFPPADVKPNLLMFTVPCELTPTDTEYQLISQEDKRYFYCNIKTLNLIPSVLYFENAKEAGCQETVLYRQSFGQKRVTEGAHSNVLILKDGVLKCPPRDNLILPGITLKHLLMLAKQVGIPTEEKPFTLEEVFDADEVIVSASSSLGVRCNQLDGNPVGGKDPENIRKLQDAYMAYYEKDTSSH